MIEHKNKPWLVVLLAVLACAVVVEGASLVNMRRERMAASWLCPTPWGFATSSPLSRMWNGMDRFVWRRPFGWGSSFAGLTRTVAPVLELKDSGKDYTVTAELPGFDRSDLNVSVEGRILNVSGDSTGTHHLSWFGHPRRSEIGQFQSAIELPEQVDPSRMDATYTHGVLKITVPKDDPENGARKVTIQ